MAFPLQNISTQPGSRREPINQQNLLRMEDGSTRIHRGHRNQPYRFTLVWDNLTESQALAAYEHFELNKTTADVYTWDDGVDYSLNYVGTPQKRPSDGKTATGTLWRFEAELVGRTLGSEQPFSWLFEVFDFDSAELGYVTEMCTLTPMLGSSPYPVRSVIFSMHGANNKNSSYAHANRIRPYIEQAVAESIIEPIKVVFPSNGNETHQESWYLSPVLDMLDNEIFPSEPTGFKPSGVIHEGLHGHSLGAAGSNMIGNNRSQFNSATGTSGSSWSRYQVIDNCTRTNYRAYIGHHIDDPVNPITTTEFTDWTANTCARTEMSGDLLSGAPCDVEPHDEACLHPLLYDKIWAVHQRAIDDQAGP